MTVRLGDKCRDLFGCFRCNFVARYDLEAAQFKTMTSVDAEKLIEALRPRTYVCDICTACGEQRSRPPK